MEPTGSTNAAGTMWIASSRAKSQANSQSSCHSIRIGSQSQVRQGARPRGSSAPAAAGRRGDRMRRRAILAGIGATVGWPLAARAQQQRGVPVVGFLTTRSQEEAADHKAAFLRGLDRAGYAEERNVHVEYRWTELAVSLCPLMWKPRHESRGPIGPFGQDAATTPCNVRTRSGWGRWTPLLAPTRVSRPARRRTRLMSGGDRGRAAAGP